jgi:IS5 family transposase
MGMEQIGAINARIHTLYQDITNKAAGAKTKKDGGDVEAGTGTQAGATLTNEEQPPGPVTHKCRVLFDATACPQDIAYPTDLGLLSEAREKSQELIDVIYEKALHLNKPRTYRKEARKEFLKIAQKKNKSRKEIRKGVGKQLRYLARNLRSLDKLLDKCDQFPLDQRQQKYLMVIHRLYQQQKEMFDARGHSVEDRIVSIHQPHVRPIVRGKTNAKVEFGAKVHISLVDGYAFLDEISWDAFNEGSHLSAYVEQYRQRFGYYPKEVLADQIYWSRKNRTYLKGKGIRLLAKPLGRPSAVDKEHVRPGERNPVEGKFGQAKTAYGLNNIRARLKGTSESWIACIFLVLNLVKLAGIAPLCLVVKITDQSFSAIAPDVAKLKQMCQTWLAHLLYDEKYPCLALCVLNASSQLPL